MPFHNIKGYFLQNYFTGPEKTKTLGDTPPSSHRPGNGGYSYYLTLFSPKNLSKLRCYSNRVCTKFE